MSALGLMETNGLLAAIEAADAMLKAANVRLLERHFVGAGLVTVTVAGEVSAVRAAVDAGTAAVQAIRADALVSAHVIARPDVEVGGIITLHAPAFPESSPSAPAAPPSETEGEHGPLPAGPGAVAGPVVRYDISRLKKMSTARLRDLARAMTTLSMTREDLEKARKNDLIEALVKAYRQEEE